jgi:restriction endonuclease S subunit
LSEPVKLPRGWIFTKFDECIDHIIGGDWGNPISQKIQKEFVKVHVLRSTELKNWKNEKGISAETRIIKKSSLEKRKLDQGNIILEISGGGTRFPVGRSVIIDNDVLQNSDIPLVCSNFFRKITISDFLDANFASYFLDYNYQLGKTREFKKQSVNIQNLNTKEYLSKLLIKIPPINEQKRIVSKIEELFSELDIIKNRLQKVKLQLVQYQQSLLKFAFEGKLTEEWRRKNPYDKKITKNNNSLPNGWDFVPLNEIADINPVKSKNAVDDNLDISFLPMKCVEALTGKYDLSNIKKYGEVKKGYTFFKNKDIIFAKITPCMENGKIAIVNNLKNGMGFGSTEFHVIRLKDNKMSQQFYFYYLIQNNFRGIAQRNMKGSAGQLRISTDYMKNVFVPITSFEEQKQIINKIEEKFIQIKNNENKINSSLTQLKILYLSILKQAFEGKLVTQNPKEGSVEKLFEEIKKKKNLS